MKKAQRPQESNPRPQSHKVNALPLLFNRGPALTKLPLNRFSRWLNPEDLDVPRIVKAVVGVVGVVVEGLDAAGVQVGNF